MDTLPDYIKRGLDIVFVGINPSSYSVDAGHYFANPRNRFWEALRRSGMVDGEVTADLDHTLLDQGIGFTDVVKRPTSQASKLSAEDFRRWAPVLKEKLVEYQPLIVCFHGLMAYGNYLRYGEGTRVKPALGLQDRGIDTSAVFVVPNPSPANAKFSVEDLAGWYRKLNVLRAELKSAAP